MFSSLSKWHNLVWCFIWSVFVFLILIQLSEIERQDVCTLSISGRYESWSYGSGMFMPVLFKLDILFSQYKTGGIKVNREIYCSDSFQLTKQTKQLKCLWCYCTCDLYYNTDHMYSSTTNISTALSALSTESYRYNIFLD